MSLPFALRFVTQVHYPVAAWAWCRARRRPRRGCVARLPEGVDCPGAPGRSRERSWRPRSATCPAQSRWRPIRACHKRH